MAKKLEPEKRREGRRKPRGEIAPELPALEFRPLATETWNDFERLFGERGACGGCWCMWWKSTRAQFDAQRGAGNRKAMQRIVQAGDGPGLIAYAGGEPIGWCSVAPRAAFPRLERSRLLKPVDAAPVWSVVCFFVDKRFRRRGVTVRLLRAAVDYARERGAGIVEGYPVEPGESHLPDPFVYNGLPSAFLRAGFVEVLRRSPRRPIMRCVTRPRRAEGRAAAR